MIVFEYRGERAVARSPSPLVPALAPAPFVLATPPLLPSFLAATPPTFSFLLLYHLGLAGSFLFRFSLLGDLPLRTFFLRPLQKKGAAQWLIQRPLREAREVAKH